MKLAATPWTKDTTLRENAHAIIEAGLAAIDTKEAILKRVKVEGDTLFIDNIHFLLPQGKLYVVGAGKCSGDALVALSEKLGDRITVGYVIDVVPRHPEGRCEVVVGDHPYSSQQNVIHTAKLISIISNLSKDDAVIFIVSGGGSAFLSQPPPGFSADEEAAVIKTLFTGGAAIGEINAVRKHLSTARGGFLAAAVHPARSLSLIFSDVPGNDLGFISSGPTVKDETTVKTAVAVLEKYDDGSNVIKKAFGALIETPKDDSIFAEATPVLFMANTVALEAMREAAKAKGFDVKIMSDDIHGEAATVGRQVADELMKSPPKTCLLYGGETTVTGKGKGTGGRNRHLALSVLSMLPPDCLIASVASDGIDNGPRAGAIADSGILKVAREKGLDPALYFENHDSHAFFEGAGGYLNSGPTGSNVADLIVAIKE